MRTSSSKGRRGRHANGRGEDRGAARPAVEFDEEARTIRVCDARLINGGQRAFCQRLLESAARRPGMGKAEVDLTAACCRIEFAGKSKSSQKMAEFFADCVQEAAAGFSEDGHSPWGGKGPSWIKLTAYPLASDVSLWETMDAGSDRMKLRHRLPYDDERQLPLLSEAISRLEGVERRQSNSRSRSLTVDFRHCKHELNGFLDRAERSFEKLLEQRAKTETTLDRGGTREAAGSIVEVAKGPKRLLYLALAGGSFMMTLVGLIVPGIPTVPFLLATSYFLRGHLAGSTRNFASRSILVRS